MLNNNRSNKLKLAKLSGIWHNGVSQEEMEISRCSHRTGDGVSRVALVTGCPGRARDGVIEGMEEESAVCRKTDHTRKIN